VQSRFQTRSYFSYRDYNSESQKSFSKTDLNLEYKPNGLRVEFMLYLRNIEGQRIMLGATEYGAASVYRFQFAEPRTYGGRMTYKF
jgi:iron complex outermembrane receptor protein